MTNTQYSERLYPAIGTQIALALSFPMVFLAALPFGTTTALLASSLGGAAVMLLANLSSPKVSLDETLRAGRFNVPLSALGEATVLDQQELKQAIGPGANPAAQLVIRGDLKRAAKLEISDPADPTPYLIISSRRPEELIAAIHANRA